jgi:hypothetical protein
MSTSGYGSSHQNGRQSEVRYYNYTMPLNWGNRKSCPLVFGRSFDGFGTFFGFWHLFSLLSKKIIPESVHA